MNPFDNFSWFMLKRHEELMKRADEIRLINEAYPRDPNEKRGLSKFLAAVGREIGCLGYSLEVRFGSQPEPQTTLSQEGNLGGCV